MVSAKILKDSTNWLGNRLTTLELTYPRYIHAEFMTHRVLSKNSASSRAIPVEKMVEQIKENPVLPIWTKNKKGMQGDIIVDEKEIDLLNEYLKIQREDIIRYIDTLKTLGIHKQNINRYLEPFQHIKIICTGTEWDNFFELRCHPDAQPEIRELAEKIRFEMAINEPEYLEPGQWHIPFEENMPNFKFSKELEGNDEELDAYNITKQQLKLKISVARCARISYLTHDGQIDYKKDIELYDRLVANNPKHLSPTEHQARVPTEEELDYFYSGYEISGNLLKKEDRKVEYKKGKYVSNLNGWIQYRKLIEDETHG